MPAAGCLTKTVLRLADSVWAAARAPCAWARRAAVAEMVGADDETVIGAAAAENGEEKAVSAALSGGRS